MVQKITIYEKDGQFANYFAFGDCMLPLDKNPLQR